MPALDYSRVAEIYDAYCVFTADIPFFASLAAEARGPVLELMAGTGRVSLPLISRGVRLTCIDSVPGMLAVLGGKLRESGLRAELVCADVREIPLDRRFELILLPFQGLDELLTPEDQRRTLRAAAEHLAPGGRFICTLHNPGVRLRSIDGEWREVGVFPHPGLGTLRLAIKAVYRSDSKTVEGQQRIGIEGEDGSRREILLDLRFSLPTAADLVSMASAAGLKVASLLGDYAGNPFEEATSPVVIATLEKA